MTMPVNYEFQPHEGESHACESRREGDWIIFECPHCSYIRKWNLETDEMKVVDGGDSSVRHRGMHKPVGLDTGLYHPN